MSVMECILNGIKKKKMHMTLLDPADQSPSKSADIARAAERAGSDALMIGGSTGVTMQNMDDTVSAIKEAVNLPVILFPTSSETITNKADAIYFMSMLNSKNRDFIIGHQVKAAYFIKKMGLETLSMAYLIVEPGMTVGRVAEAMVIEKNDLEKAVSYCLAAEFLGFKMIYLEAGSGAPYIVSPEMVKAVKAEINIPLIIGGGIKTPEDAKKLVEAGADIIVTGTLVEETEDIYNAISSIVRAI